MGSLFSGFASYSAPMTNKAYEKKKALREWYYLDRERAAWLDAPGRLEKQHEYYLIQMLNRLKSGLKLFELSPSEKEEIKGKLTYRRHYEDLRKDFEEMKSEIKRMEREEAAGTWKSNIKSLQKQIIEILKKRREEGDLLSRIESQLVQEEEQKKEEQE